MNLGKLFNFFCIILIPSDGRSDTVHVLWYFFLRIKWLNIIQLLRTVPGIYSVGLELVYIIVSVGSMKMCTNGATVHPSIFCSSSTFFLPVV